MARRVMIWTRVSGQPVPRTLTSGAYREEFPYRPDPMGRHYK